MAANNNSDVAVVMLPFPDYGHLTPLLRLSRLVSSYGIPVYFATYGAQNDQLKLRLKDWKLEDFPNLHLHNLSSPPAVEESMEALYSTLRLLGEPVSALCRELSRTCRKVVMIHDTFMLGCAHSIHPELMTKVEMYLFHAIPAFTIFSWFQQVTKNDDYDHLFLPLETHIPSMETCGPPEMGMLVKWLQSYCTSKCAGQIFNTCRDMEGPYLDSLAKHSEKPAWGLGPFNPVHVQPHNNTHRCIEWLDKQPKHSVIFVSFGTVATFSPEQISELAFGLEQSGQKFIWVLRSKDKRDGTANIPNIELPTGFEERVAARGIIARDWVPQLQILAHPSTGGYLFHSGWNSFLESVTMGVPMATWPLHADNPYDDVLITKVLKVGLVVRDWARRGELVTSTTIECAVRTLMDSPQGEEIRQRAIELSKIIKMSVTDGGATQKQMESFIAHITT